MKYENIDIPKQLNKALEHNRLVVFVGAGVSCNPPSNLPNFRRIRKGIESISRMVWNEDSERVEQYLDRVNKQTDLDVHGHVRHILGNPDTECNSLHKNIIRLFERGKVRIVTTNQEELLEKSFRELYPDSEDELEVYNAPALPRGSNFSGIVHLHGNAFKLSSDLILTATDYGRAYLTEGWATGFLKEMFNKYDVLLIGYSNDDFEISYIERGLPPQSNNERYILYLNEPDADENKWKLHNIIPIPFPVSNDGNDYQELIDSMQSWAEDRTKDAAAHASYILRLADGHPDSLSEIDASYLVDSLDREDRATVFTEKAKKPEWIEWANNQGLLTSLFDPLATLSPAQSKFACWFAEEYCMNHHDAALNLLANQKGLINPQTAFCIARFLGWYKGGNKEFVVSKWIAVLSGYECMATNGNWVDWLISDAIEFEGVACICTMIDLLTAPKLTGRNYSSYFKTSKPLYDITPLKFASTPIDYHWKTHIVPRLDKYAMHLEPILSHNLTLAHHLRMSTLDFDDDYNVDLNDQLRSHLPKLLYNFMTDIAGWFIDKDPDHAIILANNWLRSETPLLKKLALYAINKTDISGSGKLNTILSNDLLFKSFCDYEVFDIIIASYKESEPQVKTEVLKQVREFWESLPHDEYDEENEPYPVIKVVKRLIAMRVSDPEDKQVSKFITHIHSAYPQYSEMTQASIKRIPEPQVENVQPTITEEEAESMTAEEIVQRFTDIVDEYGQWMREFDLRYSLHGVVKEDFGKSLEVAQILVNRGIYKEEIWDTLINAWSSSSLTNESWKSVLDLINDNLGIVSNHIFGVSWLLSEGSKRGEGKVPVEHIPISCSIARTVNEILIENDQGSGVLNGEIFEKAWNSSGGHLARFWIQAISKVRNDDSDNWENCIPDNLREGLEYLIFGENQTSKFARILTAMDLPFLFNSDSAWSNNKILPWFNWTGDAEKANEAWEGYLKGNRPYIELVKVLYPDYVDCLEYLHDFSEEFRKAYVRHIASIKVIMPAKEFATDWLDQFLTAFNVEERVWFAIDLGQYIDSLDESKAVDFWNDWLRGYWNDRSQSHPIELSEGEVAHMCNWIDKLKPVFNEVSDLICKSPNPSFDRLHIFINVLKEEMIERFPKDTLTLIECLLRRASRDDFTNCHYTLNEIVNIVKAVRPQVSENEPFQSIYNSLIGFGYTKATALLNDFGLNE
jgi:hypothetical protein